MAAVSSKSRNNSTDQARALGVRECLRALATPIQFLKSVGPKRAELLEAAGLSTVEDILYHLPFRFEDRRQLKKIGTAVLGQEESFVGELVTLQTRFVPRRRMQMMSATLRDDTGSLDLLWFRAPAYLVSGLAKGQILLVHGKVERGLPGRLRIVHPDFEVVEAGEEASLQRVLPIYLRPGGLPLSFLRKLVGQALTEYGRFLPNRLPAPIAARQRLLDIANGPYRATPT